MEQNHLSPFIFFLTLEESLPRNYYVFDAEFKDLGFILVPVKIDQLQTLVASSDQTQIIVIASVSDAKEMRAYNERVRGLLKFVLKSKRITFMHLSSFSKVNDFKIYAHHKNYFFLKFPFDASALALRIARFYHDKTNSNIRWPGGRRAGLGALS